MSLLRKGAITRRFSPLPEAIDSYYDPTFDNVELTAVHPTQIDEVSAAGQSFTTPSLYRYKLYSAKFYICKQNLVAGHLKAVLYSHTGIYGISSLPDIMLAESELVHTDDIIFGAPGPWQLVEFYFLSNQQYRMESETHYCIVVLVNDAIIWGNQNTVWIGMDPWSPTHNGNLIGFSSGAWAATPIGDLLFYVYGVRI